MFDDCPVLQLKQLSQIIVGRAACKGEGLDLVFPVVSGNAATKSGQRQMRHNLREDKFARIHWQRSQSG